MGQLSESFLDHNPLFERGVTTGAIRAQHRGLLLVLQTRWLRVSEAQRARIEATQDEATLDAWMRAAVTAATMREVLRHGPATAKAARKSW